MICEEKSFTQLTVLELQEHGACLASSEGLHFHNTVEKGWEVRMCRGGTGTRDSGQRRLTYFVTPSFHRN